MKTLSRCYFQSGFRMCVMQLCFCQQAKEVAHKYKHCTQTFQQHKQQPRTFQRIKVISSLVSLISSSQQPGSEKRQLKPLQQHHTEPPAVPGQTGRGNRMDVFLHRPTTMFLMSPALQQLDTSPGVQFLDTCPCPGSWIRSLSCPQQAPT